MEHNEMDRIFRNIINENNSELTDQERASKIDIWNELDVTNQKHNFHFWKIAAAILFLLWGGTAWFFSNKINHNQLAYTELQSNFEEVKNKLTTLEFTYNEEVSSNKIEKEKANDSDKLAEASLPPIIQKEIIEKLIYVRDTIFVNQNISPKQLVQVVKDTVFIEIPVKKPFKMTELKNEKDQTPNNQPKPKTPSQVEFVFGKKPLKKPTQQNKLIIINENEVAKKTKRTNSSLIKIPIKN